MAWHSPEPPHHLQPWQYPPGQSGNPRGSSRKQRLTSLLKETFDWVRPDGRTVEEILVIKWLENAANGNYGYFREILERTEGKVPAGEPEQPFNLSELTEEASRDADEYRPDLGPGERPVDGGDGNPPGHETGPGDPGGDPGDG